MDISNNLVGDNAESGLLSNNNAVDGNTNMDTKAKSNPDNNMTSKDDNDFCKDNFIIKGRLKISQLITNQFYLEHKGILSMNE